MCLPQRVFPVRVTRRTSSVAPALERGLGRRHLIGSVIPTDRRDWPDGPVRRVGPGGWGRPRIVDVAECPHCMARHEDDELSPVVTARSGHAHFGGASEGPERYIGKNFWIRQFLISATYTFPLESTAMWCAKFTFPATFPPSEI